MIPTGGRRTPWVGALAATAALLAGCGSTQPGAAPASPSPRSTASRPTSTPTPRPTASSTAAHRSREPRATPPATHRPSHRARPRLSPPTKVLVVMEENHSYAQMRAGMPFLAGLSQTYGYATHWQAITHPSAPNYLAIAGGSTFGVTDDAPPSAHEAEIGSAPSVFDQALAAGRTAGTYAESMPGSCVTHDAAPYAVRHNPWAYFPAGRDACRAHDLPLDTFARDAATNALPNVGLLVPDLDHDAHDGSLATADAWLRTQLRPVLASRDFVSGRLVVVVTADEDDRHSGNTVLTSVLTPALSGKVADTPLNHYSLTRFVDEVLGVSPLGNARTAPDLRAAFGF